MSNGFVAEVHVNPGSPCLWLTDLALHRSGAYHEGLLYTGMHRIVIYGYAYRVHFLFTLTACFEFELKCLVS